MIVSSARFTPIQRTLHWVMFLLVIAALFIGIGMVSTLHSRFLTLIAIHKALGITILVLALIRLGVRLRRGAPPLPADLPRWQVVAAKGSHALLYSLLLALPLVGWSMLCAGGYPIVIYGAFHLPHIVPHGAALYAILRPAHTVLAIVLFLAILLHIAAALFHVLVRHDDVFESMSP
jgi:cytochrome b561